MGSLGDNGGGWPPDGGLPNVPPEWGDIVIPDDLSSLADEVAAVRAELGQSRPRTRWQRFTDRPAIRGLRRMGSAGLRVPVLIIALAVMVTVASVFASAWPGPLRPPTTQRTAGTPNDGRSSLPALELVGAGGETVPLLGRLPAVVLLIDGCSCEQLVTDTATAVPADVTVVTVASGPGPRGSAPAGAPGPPQVAAPQVAGKVIRQLWDPTGELRSAFDLAAPDGTAVALLVDHTATVLRINQRTASVEDLRPDLARL